MMYTYMNLAETSSPIQNKAKPKKKHSWTIILDVKMLLCLENRVKGKL